MTLKQAVIEVACNVGVWVGGYLVGRGVGRDLGWRSGVEAAMREASTYLQLVNLALRANGLPAIPNPFRTPPGPKETLH